MEKLFVLSNKNHRFDDDLFPCGTHVPQAPCPICDINLNEWQPPLLYWWEYEFGNPRASLAAQHNCFWGHFRMIVDPPGKSILLELGLPFTFYPSQMTEGSRLFEGQESLQVASLCQEIDASAIHCKNEICEHCGRFSERRRQITRLKIPKADIPESGIFTVKQNGPNGPMFVTESTRARIESTAIVGIGFYPAGRVI